MSFRHVVILSTASAVVLSLPARSNDFQNIDDPSNRVMYEDVGGGSSNPYDEATRAILEKARLWPAGHKLIVCFVEGDDKVRGRIAGVANLWKTTTNISLSFDFGTAPSFRTCGGGVVRGNFREDIRIGFREKGNKSAVGNDSHRGSGPSMNLGNFDTSPPYDEYFAWVVLHEFGHALGLLHEHQSPTAVCRDQFDLPAIQKRFGWSAGKMALNFDLLEQNSRKYEWGPFDSNSVMLYVLDPELYRQNADGKPNPCQVALKAALSPDDKRTIERMYPAIPPGLPAKERARGADDVLADPKLPKVARELAKIRKELSELPD